MATSRRGTSPQTAHVMTENGDKLSKSHLQFIKFLVEKGNVADASRALVDWELEQGLRSTACNDDTATARGYTWLKKPAVQDEYWRQMEQIKKHNIADGTEVMMYFTSVMRGEIKDQFGLDASLSDRTTAAKELAKRTVDMENRMAGKPDAVVTISLDWKRNKGR